MRAECVAGWLAVVVMAAVALGEEGGATKPALPTYTVGQVVEVKSGGSWSGAKIVNKDGDVYWVNYDKFKDKVFNEWVTVDRIRKPGETRDVPFVMPTPRGQKPSKEAREQALVNLGLAEAKPAPAVEAGAKVGAGAGGAAEEVLPAGVMTMDWSGTKEIGLTDSGKGYVADVGAVGKWSGAGGGAVGLGPVARGGTIRMEGLLVTSVETGKIGVAYGDWAARKVPERVQFADLKTGQANAVVPMPENEKALALSPDGKRVLNVMTEAGTGWNGNFVDVCTISGTTVKSVAMFMPGVKEDKPWRQVLWGMFVDDDHVLVGGRLGRVTLFSIPDAKAVYTMKEGPATPGLSANRKYAAFPVSGGTAIVDALTGETVAALPTTGSGAIFRNDGAEAAVYGWGRIWVYEVATKKVLADIFLPSKMTAGELEWVAPDYLLMNRGLLVSVPKGAVIWKYSEPEGAGGNAIEAAMMGGKLWVAATRSIGTGAGAKSARSLVAVSLPDAAATAIDAKLRVEDLMVVHPGVKVSLDVSVGSEEGNAAITTGLTEALTKNGMTVEAGQPIVVQARVSADKSHEMVYEKTMTFEKTKASVNDMKGTVSILVDGKEAWGMSAMRPAPTHLDMKQGESVEQAIAEEQAKSWQMLTGVELPKMLPAPRETPGFGESPLVPGTGKK